MALLSPSGVLEISEVLGSFLGTITQELHRALSLLSGNWIENRDFGASIIASATHLHFSEAEVSEK